MKQIKLPANVNLVFDEGNVSIVGVSISVEKGLWKGAKCFFILDFSIYYPQFPPTVDCHTKIYHPNVDWLSSQSNSASIDFSTICQHWKPNYTLQTIVDGLLALFTV